MVAGLRVRGTHGIYQIDENTVNLSLRAKGTVVFNTAHPAGTTSGQIDYVGEFPVLVLHVPVGNGIIAGISEVYRNGNSWQFVVAAAQRSGFTGIFQAEWFIYDRPANTGGAGLRLRDASGNVRFHSNDYPMRIAGYNDGGVVPGRKYGFMAYGRYDHQETEREEETSSGTIEYTTYWTRYFTGWFNDGNGTGSDTRSIAGGTGQGAAYNNAGLGPVDLGGAVFTMDVTNH